MAAPGLDEMSRRAILMDFGIAKILGGSTSITKTGLMGTLDYIAPEQIMSARAVDHHADIYSLGVVVYQMLTGELPFKADVPAQVLFAHLQRPAPDPREIVPALPDYTARAVLRALAKDPEERFPSAGAFAEALG
jgi:serine/threonine-protein kinase